MRPQGGGTRNIDDEAVFAAIVYVLTTGCAWRHLPPCFGASKSTVHRRFTIWSDAGLWGRLHLRLRELLADSGLVDVSRVLVDTAHVRAKRGGELTGPSPVDRGKPGSKLHVLSDRVGLPLIVGVSAANCHDSNGLRPLVEALTAKHDSHRGRPWKPGKVHADKAYDNPPLRRWLRGRRIGVRIARKGVDTSQRLGRHRWAIERTVSWLTGYRRLTIRYEHRSNLFPAFTTLAAALICFKRHRDRTT